MSFTEDAPPERPKDEPQQPALGLDYVRKHFGRFLSPTGEGKATRYGSNETIGLERDPATMAESINTRIVVALTHGEAVMYRREYNRMVNEGALRERTPADYAKFAGLSPN